MGLKIEIKGIEELEKKLEITTKLLEERQKLLEAIPQCSKHGYCVPHALEWVQRVAEFCKGMR